jgi:hypothetical protein
MTDYVSDFLMAGTQPHEDDKRLFVSFSFEPRLDRASTDKEGRNMYRDVEFVTIRIPGDKTVSIHRPVTPSDKQRFPLQYAAFKNNRGEQIVGTPLNLWPGIRPSQIKELEYFNVRTVEQLASMPDSNVGQLMGVQALKRAAQQYISAAKDAAPLMEVQKELKERDSTIAALQSQIKQQGEQLDKILANLGRGQAEDISTKKGK